MCHKDQFWGLYFLIFFLNDLYFFLKKTPLHKYTFDNTLSAYSPDLNLLIDILSEKSQTVINWLKANHLIVNPKKFQAMLVSKRKYAIPEDLTICIMDVDIKPKNSVKLLGITLDNKLNSENHISSICKSASCQLNTLFKLKCTIFWDSRNILIESFFYSSPNFLWYGISVTKCYHKRLKTCKKELSSSSKMTIEAVPLTF